MVYYKKTEYPFIGFEKSHKGDKMYNAVLKNIKTEREVRVPFGDSQMENYRDITGLNLYQSLIHGDEKRRKRYKARHKGYLKAGYYSPGFFSYYYLW